ncbi:N-terminal glutamine amidase-domain-containing protein [Infundibulicybe gibba]|nr:N-terminal glutamine amidase-domain-containing protein [Infundibulicybe gibba]
MDPPSLPPGTIYTSHWCEENVYLLCQAFSADAQVSRAWHISAVFISNPSKSVALWSQKLSPEPGHAVVWDYHAILVLRPTNTGAQSWVYDFDSCLPMPCPFPVYVQHTFSAGLPGAYQSVFRAVESRAFVDHFASDRSHMLLYPTRQRPRLRHTTSLPRGTRLLRAYRARTRDRKQSDGRFRVHVRATRGGGDVWGHHGLGFFCTMGYRVQVT